MFLLDNSYLGADYATIQDFSMIEGDAIQISEIGYNFSVFDFNNDGISDTVIANGSDTIAVVLNTIDLAFI